MTPTVKEIEKMLEADLREFIWFKAPGDTEIDVSLSVLTIAVKAAETYGTLHEILDTLDIPYCYPKPIEPVGLIERWNTKT